MVGKLRLPLDIMEWVFHVVFEQKSRNYLQTAYGTSEECINNKKKKDVGKGGLGKEKEIEATVKKEAGKEVEKEGEKVFEKEKEDNNNTEPKMEEEDEYEDERQLRADLPAKISRRTKDRARKDRRRYQEGASMVIRNRREEGKLCNSMRRRTLTCDI
jgi:hypothetical protein